MSVAACSRPVADCSYEVILKNKDTKGQLMSLQQTLRQEIHAKIGAQSAEESAKRKVCCTCCTQPSWADPSSLAGLVSFKNHAYDKFLQNSIQLSCTQGCNLSCTTCMSGLHGCRVTDLLSTTFVSCSWSWQRQCWSCVGERVAGQHARAAGGAGPGDYGP